MKPHGLLALLLLGIAAQTNAQIPSLGETVEVSIVNVDVVVTDKQGNRVRGLKPDDFEIYDGKARKPISNFAEYTSGTAEVTADVPRDEARPQKRTVVLFLELMRLRPHDVKPFVDSIRKTLRALVRPGDSAALVLWLRGSTVQIDFTDDLSKFDSAFATFEKHATGVQSDEDRMAYEMGQEIERFEREVGEFSGTSLSVAQSEGQGEEAVNAVLRQRAMAEMRARIAAIDAVISSMAGDDGRRILLLAPKALGEIAGPSGNDIRRSFAEKDKYGTEKLLKPVLENANASGVTIYPLYAPGLRSSMPDAISDIVPDPTRDYVALLNQKFSLDKIAEKTGGLSALTVTDIVTLLPRIEEDVTDYYSLAFRGDARDADRVRDIVVKTKNRDYLVRSRRQYVEKSDASRMKDRVAATLALTPVDSFDITAEAGPAKKSRTNETVPLTIRIPISSLTVVPEGKQHAGAFSVFVAAGTEEGMASEVVQKTQPFRIADVEKARAGHFTYSLDVVVGKDADRIAVGVLDEVSKEYALLRVALR